MRVDLPDLLGALIIGDAAGGTTLLQFAFDSGLGPVA